jgi:hypothetical protein
MGYHVHHHGEHHAHRFHSYTSMCTCGVTVALLVCTVCAKAMQSGHHCGAAPCRSLAAADEVHAEQSFVDFLGDEDPVSHIMETYEASGASGGAVAWLVHTVG